MPETESAFNRLFEKLTGIHPDNAIKGEDGYLFIPPESNLTKKSRIERLWLSNLADDKWRNHIVDGEYAGWWICPPTP